MAYTVMDLVVRKCRSELPAICESSCDECITAGDVCVAYRVMAYTVMAYTVMANVVMAS